MGKRNRDDFTEAVKRQLIEQAAHHCANPECRRITAFPHSDGTRTIRLGRASHIKAASPGGPRYDPHQTSEERRSIENGIWLCTECADIVDRDDSPHTVDTLQVWKSMHREWVRNGGPSPPIPEVFLKTLKGLTVPDTPGKIDGAMIQEFREHSLILRNTAYAEITMIQARVQLPEPVVAGTRWETPPGINMAFEPIRPQMIATAGASGSVTRNRSPLPSNICSWQIDRLPPSQEVFIGFVTSRRPWDEHDICFDTGWWASCHEPPHVMYYIDGQFQCPYRGSVVTKSFFAPIVYEKERRQFVLKEVNEGRGEWQPVMGSFFS